MRPYNVCCGWLANVLAIDVVCRCRQLSHFPDGPFPPLRKESREKQSRRWNSISRAAAAEAAKYRKGRKDILDIFPSLLYVRTHTHARRRNFFNSNPSKPRTDEEEKQRPMFPSKFLADSFSGKETAPSSSQVHHYIVPQKMQIHHFFVA